MLETVRCPCAESACVEQQTHQVGSWLAAMAFQWLNCFCARRSELGHANNRMMTSRAGERKPPRLQTFDWLLIVPPTVWDVDFEVYAEHVCAHWWQHCTSKAMS